MKTKIVKLVPPYTSKCRKRKRITQDEFLLRANTFNCYLEQWKHIGRAGSDWNEHLYPEEEGFGYWEWLDSYYEDELVEKKSTLWANLSKNSKQQKYIGKFLK